MCYTFHCDKKDADVKLETTNNLIEDVKRISLDLEAIPALKYNSFAL